MPKVILTGNPGGTVIVIRSRNLTIISSTDAILCSLMIKIQYEATDRQNKNIKNLDDCF